MKSNTTRIELTIMTVALATLIALALAPAFWGRAFGRGSNPSNGGSNPSNESKEVRAVVDGQQTTIEGIVVKRAGQELTVGRPDGAETVVLLTSKTEIRTVRKGLFRRDRVSTASDIVRGLRLSVEGTGNAEGQLVARNIRFDERDLRTAQSIESRVGPVASQLTAPERTEVVSLSNLP